MRAKHYAIPSQAQIGPNAILQVVAVLDSRLGPDLRDQVMARAGVAVPPEGAGMQPEGHCAAVHRSLRRLLPDQAPDLLHQAGLSTGEYILRHRIPPAVRGLLRAAPAPVAALLLGRAIRRHAWTFAGSGEFAVLGWSPPVFEVRRNPLILGETAPEPLCHWHAAVFTALFSRLVWPGARMREVACAAAGAPACRFELSREAAKDVR